jgi:hypothetical protein
MIVGSYSAILASKDKVRLLQPEIYHPLDANLGNSVDDAFDLCKDLLVVKVFAPRSTAGAES